MPKLILFFSIFLVIRCTLGARIGLEFPPTFRRDKNTKFIIWGAREAYFNPEKIFKDADLDSDGKRKWGFEGNLELNKVSDSTKKR